MTFSLWVFVALAASARAYWLMGIEDFITSERIDPVVSPGKISGHVHSVLGGSNFRFNTSTDALRQSECTSVPIPEDKSNYWFPHLYFQWSNGSFTSLNGGAVIYYLFSDTPGTTTAFPDNFRMLSGDPTLRTYDANSYAQQAVTFLCLDFNGVSTRHNELPAKACPSGIRAQINFPSCWDGKNLDSPDHKSHVAFLSGGPDSGTCSDPKFPVTLPRIFIEVYWASNDFEGQKSHAMNPSQPFVYSYGDPTGYGYHADFINGWDKGVLQNAVDKCHCNPYGDPQCCVDQGIFHLNKLQSCRITKSINEQTTGTLLKLPGNNPVQPGGQRATMFPDNTSPQLMAPVYAYTGDVPTLVGSVIPGSGAAPVTTPVATPPSSTSAPSSTHVPQPATSSSPSSPSPSSASSISHSAPATTSSPVVVEPPHTSSIHATVPNQAPTSSSAAHSQVPSTSVGAPASSTTPAPSGDGDDDDDDDLPWCDDDGEPEDGPSSSVIVLPSSTTVVQPSTSHVRPPPPNTHPSSPASPSPAPPATSPPEEDNDPECDEPDEPSSTSAHIPAPTAHPSTLAPPPPPASSTPEEDNDPECDEPDEPSSTSVHVPTPVTSFAHTIPATVTRKPAGIPTFSMPVISMPPVPTFSMPSVPNAPHGQGSYGNNPGVHVAPPPPHSPSGGSRKCPLRHRDRKSKRGLLEVESVLPTSPAPEAVIKARDVGHSHGSGSVRRLHFRKQFMRRA